jgi:hypothetical protein
MTLSVVLTIHQRLVPVLEQVFESLRHQTHDELIIVLDRAPLEMFDYASKFWRGDSRVKFVTLGDGPDGWRSPVKAWNAGFAAVTGDVVYCLSSETVQAEGNIYRARMALGTEERHEQTRLVAPGSFQMAGTNYVLPVKPIVLHGRAECSCGPSGQEVNWNGTAPGNLLCDAAHPRPLGFIWAAPIAAVRQIGGYDEAFDAGFWYDDADFFLRLWRTGLDFVFDDSISGIHLHHERPVLDTPEGQEGIRKNTEYMLWKHGILAPWGDNLPRTEERKPGRTIWRHL